LWIRSRLELQRRVETLSRKSDLALKMRCGLHAGGAETRYDYFGPTVNGAAWVMVDGRRKAAQPRASQMQEAGTLRVVPSTRSTSACVTSAFAGRAPVSRSTPTT